MILDSIMVEYSTNGVKRNWDFKTPGGATIGHRFMILYLDLIFIGLLIYF